MYNETITHENEMVMPMGPDLEKGGLLLKLYASAIRNVKQAILEIDSGEKKAEEILSLGKAYWILEYFIESLDYNVVPDLCSQLEELYHVMMEQMTNAYNEMDSSYLQSVQKALEDLHQTWSEAVSLCSNEKGCELRA